MTKIPASTHTRAATPLAFGLGLAVTALLAASFTGWGAPAALGTQSTAAVRLSGAIRGLPRDGRLVALNVQAVSVSDGSIAASAVPAHGSYTMTLPRGAYLLVLDVVDLRHGHRGHVRVSSPVQANGTRRKANIALAGAGGATGPPIAARQASVSGGPGSIGLSSIPILAPAGSGIGSQAQGGLASGLLPRCTLAKRRLLDVSRKTLGALEREQRLSGDRHTGAKTRYGALTPELVVQGSVTVSSSGKALAEITVRNSETGEVVDHVAAAGDPGEDISAFLRRLGDGLGKRECEGRQSSPGGSSSPPGAGSSAGGGGEALPAPGHVRWIASYKVRRSHEPPRSYEEHASWSVEGAFDERGQAHGASVVSLSGGRDVENEDECGVASFTPSWELDGAANPIGWSLDVSALYPLAGWKYIFPASPSAIPYTETLRCSGEHVLGGHTIPAYSLMTPYAPQSERERAEKALLQPFEVEPGKSSTETRTFKYEGVQSACTSNCLGSEVQEEMTLTIEVDARRQEGVGAAGAGPIS